MELYTRVRRAVLVEGRSQRVVAREFGLVRKTVRKMLEYSLPPGYQGQLPVRRPKLGPWQTFTPPQSPAHAAHCGLVLHWRTFVWIFPFGSLYAKMPRWSRAAPVKLIVSD